MAPRLWSKPSEYVNSPPAMKLLYLLPALLLCAAPCQALSIDPNAPVPILSAKQKKTLQHAAKQMADLLKNAQSVSDRATADAFAATVKTPVPELNRRLHQAGLDEYDLNRALAPYGYKAADLLQRESELAQQYFYGSAALAAVFGAPADATEQPPAAGAEVLAELEELLDDAEDDVLDHFDDGPGFTQDTAWEADEHYERQIHPYRMIRLIPGAKLKRLIHKELKMDDEYYDVFLFEFHHQGKPYTAEMWFEITDYVEERAE